MLPRTSFQFFLCAQLCAIERLYHILPPCASSFFHLMPHAPPECKAERPEPACRVGAFSADVRGFQLPPYCLRQQGPPLGSFAGETPGRTDPVNRMGTMIKLAHRVGLPFLRADAAFIKVFSYEQKILSGSGTAAPHPCRLAGSDDEFHLLPVRHAGGGLRGAHHGVHGPLRRAGHPQDRPVPVPAWHRVGLHRRRPEVRHPALYPVQCVRYAGCHPHRCAHRPAHGGVPVQGGRPEGAHGGGHGH